MLRPVALVVIFVFSTGCLSNEYRIPRAELQRLASLPPDERGQRVRLVQEMGERRDTPPAPVPQAYGEFHVEIQGYIALPSGRSRPAPRAAPAAPRTGSWRGGGGGGGNLTLPSGGSGEELVVLAIVVFTVALLAATGLVVTEGMRFDGYTALPPTQPVHLKTGGGQELVVPLASLAPADLEGVEEATVIEDEMDGLRFLGRAPLDRRGAAFKLDAGGGGFSLDQYSVVGLASNIQLGFFPTQTFGVMAGVTLLGGTLEDGSTVARHTLSLEAQFFPAHLGRLHLGAFGHGGVVIAGGSGIDGSGEAFGGGAIIEIDLTTRMALTARADYTRARLTPTVWSGATTFTVGVAIY